MLQLVGTGVGVTSARSPFTPRAKKVCELALREALSWGQNYIDTEHILVGLLREHEGVGARVVRGHGADPEEIRRALLKLFPNQPPAGGSCQ